MGFKEMELNVYLSHRYNHCAVARDKI
uniref:Uncharacterized protein n=1 Tax=Rhizophora mucronata TaxID=61149 RepID=A0A2P2Q6D9_RHIMU